MAEINNTQQLIIMSAENSKHLNQADETEARSNVPMNFSYP